MSFIFFYFIGWDGKPIPYWLYKLHGLGVEYKCEICGNQSYWGRRAFDKHFQEWRHAHGTYKCVCILIVCVWGGGRETGGMWREEGYGVKGRVVVYVGG